MCSALLNVIKDWKKGKSRREKVYSLKILNLIKGKRFPGIPFGDWVTVWELILHEIRYQKPFDITKKTPLTSNPLSNNLYIWWVIASNCLTQESPSLNPEWLGETNLLSVKKVNSSL